MRGRYKKGDEGRGKERKEGGVGGEGESVEREEEKENV